MIDGRSGLTLPFFDALGQSRRWHAAAALADGKRNVRFLYYSVGFAALSPKTHFDAPRRVSLLLQQRGWNDADRVRAGFDDRAES
jgi:hypothetical protein